MEIKSPEPRKPRSKCLFFCYDETSPSASNVPLLRRQFMSRGYHVYEHNGKPFDCRFNEIDQKTQDELNGCVAFVACVSREFHRNRFCKLLSLHARKKVCRGKKKSFEMMFVMLQGDYTTMSQPHHVEGWLMHMIRDCLWYPCWSSTQLSGAVEAIIGVIVLLTHSVDIEEDDPQMTEWKEAIESFGSPNPQKISKKWIVKSPSRPGSPNRPGSPGSPSNRPGSPPRSPAVVRANSKGDEEKGVGFSMTAQLGNNELQISMNVSCEKDVDISFINCETK